MKGRIVGEKTQQVPIIGNIRVGEKDGKGLPHSLDYFRATGKYANLFHQCFGEQPNKIEIAFFSDTFSDSCNERWELRQGAKLFAYGDGEIFHVWDGKDKYEEKTTDDYIPFMKNLAEKTKGEWKKVLTLTFAVLKIKGVFGMFKFSTSAEASSMPQIISAFDTVQETAGTVINVPFDLLVEMAKSQKPGSKSVFPVVKLIPNISKEHLELLHDALDSGKAIKGLLTEDKIEGISEEKAIEYQEPVQNAVEPPTESAPDVSDVIVDTFDGVVVEDTTPKPEGEKPKGSLLQALQYIESAKTIQNVETIRKQLQTKSWTGEEQMSLDEKLSEQSQGIEMEKEQSPFA